MSQDETGPATYGHIEYLHPNNSFVTDPISNDFHILTFGRDPKCDILLDCPHVAAVQTKVYVYQNEVWVCDTGHVSGEPSLTLINKKAIGPNPQQLHPEDVIEIFERRFRFVAANKENTDPDSKRETNEEEEERKPEPQKAQEPMDYLFEQMKAMFGEGIYETLFEQWCDNKHHGKAYSTARGPQRKDYDWIPELELASLVPVVLENPITGAVEVHLPLGSFVPKLPARKTKRVARRTARRSEETAKLPQSAADRPAAEQSEVRRRRRGREEEGNDDAEEDDDDDEVAKAGEEREEDSVEGEKEKEKKRSSQKTRKPVEGKRMAKARTVVADEERKDAEDDEEDEAQKESKSRKVTARKKASKASEDDYDFNENVEEEEEPKKKKKTAVRKAKKKNATTQGKKKGRNPKNEDEEDEKDGDYDADDASDVDDLDITGLDDEGDDDTDHKEKAKEEEEEEKEEEEEDEAPKKKQTKARTAKRAAGPKARPPPAAGRHSARVTRSGAPVTAKASGAALFRATKSKGKLVDPFSPTKSLTKNYKMELKKRKKELEVDTAKGVVTRQKSKNDNPGEDGEEPTPPAAPSSATKQYTRRGRKLDL